MSDFQTIWTTLWNRAAAEPGVFEIAEVAPEIASALSLPEFSPSKEAHRRAVELLRELNRLPDGERYFALEGDAVVPLEEFQRSAKDTTTAQRTHPFEI
ncbi:MAG TPA: hypothetical protein VGZ22_04005 [Isosphaeraceae bacterium]|nr:hypothetical protein [Isosphaeraceae bacterium]